MTNTAEVVIYLIVRTSLLIGGHALINVVINANEILNKRVLLIHGQIHLLDSSTSNVRRKQFLSTIFTQPSYDIGQTDGLRVVIPKIA